MISPKMCLYEKCIDLSINSVYQTMIIHFSFKPFNLEKDKEMPMLIHFQMA